MKNVVKSYLNSWKWILIGFHWWIRGTEFNTELMMLNSILKSTLNSATKWFLQAAQMLGSARAILESSKYGTAPSIAGRSPPVPSPPPPAANAAISTTSTPSASSAGTIWGKSWSHFFILCCKNCWNAFRSSLFSASEVPVPVKLRVNDVEPLRLSGWERRLRVTSPGPADLPALRPCSLRRRTECWTGQPEPVCCGPSPAPRRRFAWPRLSWWASVPLRDRQPVAPTQSLPSSGCHWQWPGGPDHWHKDIRAWQSASGWVQERWFKFAGKFLLSLVQGMCFPSWQWQRTGSSWSPVLTLPYRWRPCQWCDLGFFPNSRGNKAAAKPLLQPCSAATVSSERTLRLITSLPVSCLKTACQPDSLAWPWLGPLVLVNFYV